MNLQSKKKQFKLLYNTIAMFYNVAIGTIRWLTLIQKKNGSYDDTTISPKIRQTLQHWGYKLTNEDYKKSLKQREK